MPRLDLRVRIKRQMQKRKISTPELARRLELNPQTLYNYLAGKSELTAGNLGRLLAELGGRIVFS